jgi:alpha-ketoglutarate-dependent taurine dioxygenase
MYVRNYDPGIGISWQQVFHTTSREEVEQYFRKTNIEYEWVDGARLRTRQVRQAVAVHPVTGETVWFNQAHIHNVLNLPSAFRESLLSMVDSREFPLDVNSFYGDGSEIEQSVFDAIHHAYRQVAVKFPWKKGDILMLDNMLIAHAREPFIGNRRIVVAMADQFGPCPDS